MMGRPNPAGLSIQPTVPFAERSRSEPTTGLGAVGFDSAQPTAPALPT